MLKLENEYWLVEITELGAEIKNIYSKKQQREILWNGDPTYWGRQSPILFPIVGRLKDNETIIENEIYRMSQHGFARDMQFEILEVRDIKASFLLVPNEDTKKIYPYLFELVVTYELINDYIKVQWTVINKDIKEIYFSIGAHPAFKIQGQLEHYYLEFKRNDEVEKISLNGPYNDVWEKVESLEVLSLSNELFKNDAIIYTNIDEVILKSKRNDEAIKVNLKGFPLVGIWTPFYPESNTTAPFLCIEPWYGLCDSINSDKIFKNKKFINKLGVSEEFNCSYCIEIE